jgi:DNA-binding GntR family transcriptional regulator
MPVLLGGKIQPRRALGEEVYQAIKSAIIKGELEPGRRLIEEQLAEDLGASRTPVRQAIHMLERENLVERQARGGFTVKDLSFDDISEILELRVVLEAFAARLAAENVTDDEVDRLEKRNEAFGRALETGRIDSLAALNTEFHDALYGLAQNRRLRRMIHDLHDHFYRYRRRLLAIKDMAATSYQDHKDMIEAMRAKDPDQTEKLVRAHIRKGKQAILEQTEGDLRLTIDD